MDVRYKSTLLAKDNSPLEIQRASLDLLKKINDLGMNIDGLDEPIEDINTKLQYLSALFNINTEYVMNLNAIDDTRFFSFTNQSTGAPMYPTSYKGAGISFINSDGNVIQIVNIAREYGLQYRVNIAGTWYNWRTLIDSINVSSVYRNDFIRAASAAVDDGFITTVIASGTITQGALDDSHPGTCRITSSTTTNSGAYISSQANALTINNVREYSCIWKPLSFTATVTTRLGFHTALTSAPPTLGIYFEAVGANLTAKSIGTYGVYTSPTLTISTGTWYQCNIKLIGNTVYYTIYNDAGSLLLNTSYVITPNSNSINSTFISTKVGTAATALVDVDLVKVILIGENPRWV